MEYHARNLTALGLLVLLATGLFVWGFFFLMGDPILAGGNHVSVAMTDGVGLNRGDHVLLNGVQVGSVRRVHLEPPRNVTVDIRIDDDLRLPADTRALARADVFGATTLSLQPGTALVALEAGDTIRGVTDTPLPELATELGGQARTILAAADSLLSPDAVANMQATAQVLPEAAAQLRGAFAELALVAASLRRTAEEMERAGTGRGTAETLNAVRGSAAAATTALGTLDATLISLGSVLDKIDQGHGTLGRMVNDTTLYNELFAAIREVRELTADVKANPKRYITVEVF